MEIKDTKNLSNEEIDAITKKQTFPIIISIVVIIVVSILVVNVPRVINCNFYDFNADDFQSIGINYNYFDVDKEMYIHESVTLDNGEDELLAIIDVISQYDYNITSKTFFGYATSIMGQGGDTMLSLSLADNDNNLSSITLTSSGDMIVNQVAYKMKSDDATKFITTLIEITG